MRLRGSFESDGRLGGVLEFVDLLYNDKLPKNGPSCDLRFINLIGLPVPSKEVVERLFYDEKYEGYNEEWNWKYFAAWWKKKGNYHIPDLDPWAYRRSWVNLTFD